MKKKANSRVNVLNFSSIIDIKDNLIILEGKRYRTVITADPINFSLLSQGEQDALEHAYTSLVLSINFPYQIVSVVQPVDLKDSLEEFHKNSKNMISSMIRYGQEVEGFLMHYATSTMITQNYIVVTHDNKEKEKYERVKNEIMRRTQVIIDGLMKCNLNPRVLNTEQLCDLIYNYFNAGKKVFASDMIENGSLSFIKEGFSVAVEKI
ncbi:MAG: hypothetical protein QME35_02975 [Thermoanaerobacteraceae bacterium]|nr:hypothetical protein [Thermoanaerobacteraceae bacterium]